MKYLFVLSKQNLKLSEQEAINLLELKKHKLADNLLVAEAKGEFYTRLAYTKKVLQYLFDCPVKQLEKSMQDFEWESVYEKNFALRVYGAVLDEADLAGYIWNNVKKPKVNLKKPKTRIELHFMNKKVYCGKVLWNNEEKFDERRAHLRPELLPTSLHPRLARCVINLTGIKGNETLLDLFCGTGGILIEAAIIGLNASGSDINPDITGKCQENLKSFKLKLNIKTQDATKIKQKFDYIVTDLPYGKNTGKMELERLYTAFLSNLKKIMKKRAVVIFPDSINYEKLIKKAKLKIEHEFSYYIHKSMTKKITLLCHPGN